MRREARVLKSKALDSLVLSIEHFNRPWDRGRPEAVLILLDRAFELLLKAAIVHKGGRIREPYAKETIGFDKCVRKCLSDAATKCLTEDQALTIQIINSLRDAAQHYVVDLSEQELYMYSQAGVTFIRNLLAEVFGEKIDDYVPARVLPVSTEPPRDLHAMIRADLAEIRRLVQPGSRRQLEAKAKLRALAIIEASLEGRRSQPSDQELNKLIGAVRDGRRWDHLFPGVAKVQLATAGTGLNVSLRITKKEGEAVHLVPEDTPGATVIAVKRVAELDYYSLSTKKLAGKLGKTMPKTIALIRHLNLQDDEKYFKEIRVNKVRFKQYSPKALEALQAALETVDMDEVWREHRPRRRTN